MISKVNNTFIYNAENRFITLSMLNVLEYSGIYYMTSGSLWNYYREECHHENDATKIRYLRTLIGFLFFHSN